MKLKTIKITQKSVSAILTAVALPYLTSCTETKEKAPPAKENILEMGVDKEKKSTVKGFMINIEKATVDNNNFRKVLYTSSHHQLVLMSLKPKEEIGEEIHAGTDQFFRFEKGNGKCIINGTSYIVKDGDAIMIPAGARHNIINTDPSAALKFYTIYSPPQHKDGIVRKSKEEAEARVEKFDGVTTESM